MAKEPSIPEQTSDLVGSLALAMERQGQSSYRGRDSEKLVKVKIDGRHQVVEVKLNADELGIDTAGATRIGKAVAEAVNMAIGRAQHAAGEALASELHGSE